MSPVLVALLRILAVVGLMLANGVVLIYMLRKVLGHLHLRLGPMHVGPKGVLQTLNDVLKLLTKEDIWPTGVDRVLFYLAPILVFTPSLMAYAAIPFSDSLKVTDLETGLLYTLAILSFLPIGVLMAGWASGSKWSLLGGMRAAGMQIAYEVPLLLSVLPVVMFAGTMNLTEIVAAQSGTWWGFIPRWNVLFPGFWPTFLLFVVASMIELNTTPFDMSEAESELVSGFATEYSAMKFGLLFLSEFSNQFIASALGVTLFFGGWMLPWVSAEAIAPIAPVVFMIKVYIGIFVMYWIRGTFPRLRIDQLMSLGWKRLIPASLAWLMIFGIVLKLYQLGSVS